MKRYLWIDLKIMFRIPLSIFFSLVYPIIMMTIILISYGNVSIGDGYLLVDKYLMLAMGMGILPLTLISFPIWIGNGIENNSTTRLKFYGINPIIIYWGDIIAHIIIALLSIITDILFAYFVFDLTIPSIGYFATCIFQYLIVVLVFMMIGSIIAYIIKNTQIIMPFGLVLMFGLYMLCGVFISLDEMPKALVKISSYIPMRYAMNDLLNVWEEKMYWSASLLKTSAVYFAIGLVVLIFFIRRNKRRWI